MFFLVPYPYVLPSWCSDSIYTTRYLAIVTKMFNMLYWKLCGFQVIKENLLKPLILVGKTRNKVKAQY